jgi:hypothetical protein
MRPHSAHLQVPARSPQRPPGVIGRPDRLRTAPLPRTIGHRLQELRCNRAVNPQAANANAHPSANMGIVASTLVTMGVTLRLTVEHTHHPTAATAAGLHVVADMGRMAPR